MNKRQRNKRQRNKRAKQLLGYGLTLLNVKIQTHQKGLEVFSTTMEQAQLTFREAGESLIGFAAHINKCR